ncbi:microtubule-associated protein TORTIFOLIA1-like [Gossypium hirsutum]|uniref:Microtubule-associated protein TORTIFOLIA1-like n=1 Tax=Gossypium hirsutum TaxID=3635 RepID=A0ABM3ADA6_GOSHI|nr:microtubule-associated protein TORTIFOLIA1-like [Gossypium hirsutum]
MGEQNKGVQSRASTCMAKMVECASDPPLPAFQKLCPRICKLLNNQNFMAKASLLPVVASLSQVGAIAPQSLEALQLSIHECLGSTDWATRKAAADSLSALALHSSNLIADRASSTITILEGCRFDRMKPVRDSMTEALQLWKKIAGKGEDGAADDLKALSHDGDNAQSAESSEKNGSKDPSAGDKKTQTSDSVSEGKGGSIIDKAVVILKKKSPALTDRELNPEFFQKLETRGLSSWSNAMHALQVGDMDSAYAEVLSTGDDLLLIKLMDRSGPMVDQLSNEIANEALHAIVQFLMEQDLFDICLSWIQQLVKVVIENGHDALGITMELKKELLLNLHEAASTMDPPENWEGAVPDQLLLQLASAWKIELQQFDK